MMLKLSFKLKLSYYNAAKLSSRILPYSFRRHFHANITPVLSCGNLSTTTATEFLEKTDEMSVPIIFRRGPVIEDQIPAMTKWFSGNTFPKDYLGIAAADAPVQYELVSPQYDPYGQNIIMRFYKQFSQKNEFPEEVLDWAHNLPGTTPQFYRFSGTLKLLLQALEFNKSSEHPIQGLYVAQNSISELPLPLRGDLPAPSLVQNAGKGDIYGTSIWIGLERTYTSWHKDPNPNIFLQMCSSKQVRLMPPRRGQELFERVQFELSTAANSNFRLYDMMIGPEWDLLEKKVWSEPEDEFLEAELGPGDALFIPNRWWHSIRSSRDDGRLNASVNWWFR